MKGKNSMVDYMLFRVLQLQVVLLFLLFFFLSNTNITQLWHMCLGHMSEIVIAKLNKK